MTKLYIVEPGVAIPNRQKALTTSTLSSDDKTDAALPPPKPSPTTTSPSHVNSSASVATDAKKTTTPYFPTATTTSPKPTTPMGAAAAATAAYDATAVSPKPTFEEASTSLLTSSSALFEVPETKTQADKESCPADSCDYIGVWSNPDDSLYFPHVDSCLAIIYITTDDEIVGGHVGAIWPGDDLAEYKGNASRIIDEMKEMVASRGSCIKQILFYHNPSEAGIWSEATKLLYEMATRLAIDEPNQITTYIPHHPKGVDLIINAQNCLIVDCATQKTESHFCHSETVLSPKKGSFKKV